MGGARRTIVVGDIHGCADEFGALLERVKYSPGVDRLVLVGDLVARGPDSGGAIARAMDAGATAVRGNHDEKVLSWWRVARAAGRERASRDVRLSERHKVAVAQMTEAHFAWLEALPLMLDLDAHNPGLLVVHAGLEPGVPLGAQQPAMLMNIRSVDSRGIATRRLEGTPWAQVHRGPPHVVFGHDARRGLQLERFATGLDSGCCYGRALTALVLDEGEPVPTDLDARRAHMVQEPARATWCPMGDGNGPE